MKRFYKSVAVGAAGNGFSILLDGLPVRTPAKSVLELPNRALAEAVAAEWAAQGESIRPTEMHLTQLASTALDRLSPMRDMVIDTVVAYAETDLLCHRASSPIELIRRQQAAWQPLLDWTAVTFDAPLRVTEGVIPVGQPPAAIAALRRAIQGCDNLHLTVLHNATVLLGSVVLGLALLHGRVDAAIAFEASQIDETFQMERWGEDIEAAARRAALRREIEATAHFARLLDA